MEKGDQKQNNVKDARFFRFAYVLIAILIVVLLGIVCFAFLSHEELIKLEVKTLEVKTSNTGCITIYAEENEKVKEYTFNDGENWQKSNYTVLCGNKEITVLGKDAKDNIIAEGSIKIDSLKENAPTINIDFDTDIEYLGEDDLLYGVTAKDSENNLIEEINTEVTLSEDGKYAVIEYSVSDKNGNTTTVLRKIKHNSNNENISEIGTISFDKVKYTCKEGEKITANITVTSSDLTSTVKGYTSANKNVATIVKHPTLTAKSPNTETVQINCLKNGTTTLSAISDKGATTEVNLTVTHEEIEEDLGTINFDKTSYSCKAGETISTVITADNNSKKATVKSYKSSNTSIATVEKDNENILKCINCVAVKIKCLKAGNVTLSATSSTGATSTSTVNVQNIDKGTISFDKQIYTCKVGEKIDATISATANDPAVSVKSYKSNNTAIATIVKHPTLSVKTPNAVIVQITCLKEGNVTLSAASSLGATTVSTVKVESIDKGTIEYEKSSYRCTAGEEIKTIITAKSNDGLATVKSYKSNNTSIATVEKDTETIVKCINCVAVKIKCIKEGNTTLSATSSLDATTSTNVSVTKADMGSISFDKTSYSCKEGEKITAEITAISTDAKATVSSYKSGNTAIATIVKHPTIVVKSPNAVAVEISCLKEGTATLIATSSTGANTSVRVNILEADKGSIKYEKSSYACNAGEEIKTIITATSNDDLATVKSYKSNNTSIATVEKDTETIVKCINCVAVKINCLKEGNTTLSATSSTGATSTSSIKVSANTKGSISFDQKSYLCKEGEILTAIITATSNDNLARVKSYKSNNTSIATIIKHPTLAVKSINATATQITCKKVGTTSLTAVSSTGAVTAVTINVVESIDKDFSEELLIENNTIENIIKSAIDIVKNIN